jgi:hypothetical protein
MMLFACSLREVFWWEDVPSVPAHELDGCFEEMASLKFDEGLEQGVVFLADDLVGYLRLDYVVDKIGICKQCHLIRP